MTKVYFRHLFGERMCVACVCYPAEDLSTSCCLSVFFSCYSTFAISTRAHSMRLFHDTQTEPVSITVFSLAHQLAVRAAWLIFLLSNMCVYVRVCAVVCIGEISHFIG